MGSQAPGALAGLKILDLTMNLPGPYLTWLLAELGAEVLKVENPAGGDYGRNMGGAERGAVLFAAVNRGKRSLSLNLKDPAGRDIFHRLLETYDILIEGFRPGVMARLGLDYSDLSRRQPRLIQVSISGYGQSGSHAHRAGHDVNYLALAGVLSITGSAEGELAVPGVQVADLFGGSLLAMAGLLAAVIQRQGSGKGQMVDTAMYDGSLSLATMVATGVEAGWEVPSPTAMLLNGGHPCYGLYRTADGGYMSLGALEPKFWQNFCAAVERPDLAGSQFGGPSVRQEVAAIFAGQSQEHWCRLFAGHDCCCEPVLSLPQALDSDLTAERGMLQTDSGGRRYLGSPLKLSGSPRPPWRPAPALGEHNRQVLAGLGLSDSEIDELKERGVI